MSDAAPASIGGEDLHPGDKIADRYEIVRVLGHGGMGIVVLARAADSGELVAIKLVRRGLLDTEEALQRFRLEARTLSELRDPHVVRVLEVGRTARGTPFMVMEYLHGSDLEQAATERAPLPIETAVSWVLQAISGLAPAHRAGIVHRDLKPGNLFLARQSDGSEIVKVLDFGVAKSLAGGPALTKEGFVLGTPSYMSPEQLASSRSVDARTDVWALGAIAYRLLGGRAPFVGPSVEQHLSAILSGRRVRLRELRPDVPPELEAVIDDCLRPELAHRVADLPELARRLAPFAAPAQADSQGFADRAPRSLGPGERLPAARQRWLITFALLLALASALVAGLALRRARLQR